MIKEPRISVGLLGATGLVGQRFIQLLDNHPYFELSVIGASSRSSCKTYENAVSFWTMSNKIPSYIASKAVVECKVENFSGCKLVFSALDASVAGEIEREFVLAGIAVFSNSRNFRMDPSVPLVVPLVNHDHIRKDILCVQQKQKEGSSFIVTNAK
jgi:aspartate-semialdehyde dehydrogenase